MSEYQPSLGLASIAACERFVAEADIVIGIYGARYGTLDSSTDLSITHLEFRWTTQDYLRPLLAFIIQGVAYEARQSDFIRNELEDFRFGVFRTAVTTIADFRHQLYRALNRHLSRLTVETALLLKQRQIETTELYHFALPLHCSDEFQKVGMEAAVGDPELGERVLALLSSNKNFIFLLGEAGSGKTWFMKQFFANRLGAYRTGIEPLLPIYLDLARDEVQEFLRSEEFLRLILANQYHLSLPLWNTTLDSDPAGASLLLLMDGYDEAVAKGSTGSRVQLLTRLLACLNPSNKIVITSRSHLFETQESLARLLETTQISLQIRGIRADSSVVFIYSLSATDVKQFLDSEYGDQAGILWDKLTRIVDLADLAKRPILLPMVCQTLDRPELSESRGRVTAGYLYRVFTSAWLSWQGGRLTMSEDSARRLFCEIGLYFHNKGKDSIFFRDIPRLFPAFFPTGPLVEEQHHLEASLRSASFLTNDPAGEYRFLHRSFLEYFLAERIVLAIFSSDFSLELASFPSKLSDSFILDILARELSWEDRLLELITSATNGIVRYLMIYLASRLAKESNETLTPARLASVLYDRLALETDPVVIRESLVTLTNHGMPVEPSQLEAHLRNPIPQDMIVRELREYYGSLMEAKLYLKERLASEEQSALRLFYLISLAAIAAHEDIPIFRLYATKNDGLEAIVARHTLQRLETHEC